MEEKMSIWKRKMSKRSTGTGNIGLMLSDHLSDIISQGYTSLADNPEVLTACRRIADLISSMTIYLMANGKNGDKRVINELSRKMDINPCSYMTRKTWMEAIVMNLLLHGKGNSIVLPITSGGRLEDLRPVPPSSVSFCDYNAYGYNLLIDGKKFSPDEVLHYTLNPDPRYPWKGKGLTVSLRDVANNLKQAAKTEKEFMSSKWKPSLVVKVDAMIDEFSSPEGRQKLVEEYISTSKAGEPWVIPADQFSLEQIRPLSLADLALADNVKLDKQTVASIIGVPAFLLGVGSFNRDEWNNFISSTIRPIAIGIQQENTKKLIVSPKMYWSFNFASLYSYDLKTLANVYGDLYTKGLVTGNEVRDRISMSPKDGLDELVILENYIPADKIADQKKLKGDDE